MKARAGVLETIVNVAGFENKSRNKEVESEVLRTFGVHPVTVNGTGLELSEVVRQISWLRSRPFELASIRFLKNRAIDNATCVSSRQRGSLRRWQSARDSSFPCSPTSSTLGHKKVLGHHDRPTT